MKTSELQGPALDWAVAKCEGYTELHKIEGRMPHEPQLGMWPPRIEYGAVDLWELSFSTDWSQGGPIIEREGISIGKHTWDNDGVISWGASKSSLFQGAPFSVGPTPLIAAMRCYVASKLGDEVEVPDDLR